MREIVLDAANWTNADDFYDSFFRAVEAPSWHGRNFNALRDSIAVGQINQIEVPYRVVISGFDRASGDAQRIALDFEDLVQSLAREGCPVEIARRSQAQ